MTKKKDNKDDKIVCGNEDTKKEQEKTNEEVLSEETSKNDDALSKKDEELKTLNDKYLRLLAEYDNFKKRTVKEKEAIYVDAAADAIKELLGVLDNLQRALDSIDDKEGSVYKGVEMVLKQTEGIFEKMGVKEIDAVGNEFDPSLHNAVMHIDDESIADNTVVEEFQKGYTYKDKVLRYSMVIVAN